MTAAPQSIQPSTALLPCPFCKKPPGSKVGPPAMARCITPECEGTKLAAYTFAEWNTHAAPPSTETPRHTATAESLAFAEKALFGKDRGIHYGDDEKDLYAISKASLARAIDASHASLTAKVAELEAALQEISSWKDDTLGARPKKPHPYNCVPEITEAFDRGARMAFYRCAERARATLDNADGGRG